MWQSKPQYFLFLFVYLHVVALNSPNLPKIKIFFKGKLGIGDLREVLRSTQSYHEGIKSYLVVLGAFWWFLVVLGDYCFSLVVV